MVRHPIHIQKKGPIEKYHWWGSSIGIFRCSLRLHYCCFRVLKLPDQLFYRTSADGSLLRLRKTIVKKTKRGDLIFNYTMIDPRKNTEVNEVNTSTLESSGCFLYSLTSMIDFFTSSFDNFIVMGDVISQPNERFYGS